MLPQQYDQDDLKMKFNWAPVRDRMLVAVRLSRLVHCLVCSSSIVSVALERQLCPAQSTEFG